MTEATYIEVGPENDQRRIAVRHRSGSRPGLVWLGGFKSDMDGTKAIALDDWAGANGLSCTRFDYSGHGLSSGDFADGTISKWAEESQAVLDRVTEGPQILIGSSMGGWMSLLLAKRHLESVGKDQSRIAGMVLIAPAADFTERLMWANFPEAVRQDILTKGRFEKPSEYSDEPYIITRDLIEDGRDNLLMDAPIETGCPVHILQGMRDEDVPWQHAEATFELMTSDDALMTLVKDGDHRLSREQDIALILKSVEAMANQIRDRAD
ncbi:alpha/beta hydrolase [Coralliovum pocilloporae]|uniref:alpha/beta hydrolase n=1 Tax=Coralliovum pocilloporae TaxID=3066369 RepID=UPI003307B0D6